MGDGLQAAPTADAAPSLARPRPNPNLPRAPSPRDKPCGDAVTAPALALLAEMDGVLASLKCSGDLREADTLALVSPRGASALGATRAALGGAPAAATVKRAVLDARLVRAAAAVPGVCLKEGFEVDPARAAFDPATALWTVAGRKGAPVRARLLILADGATSRVGVALGLVSAPPAAAAARTSISPGGARAADPDASLIFRRDGLPGVSCLARLPDGGLTFSSFAPADGPGFKGRHEGAARSDPFVAAVAGSKAKVGGTTVAPTRAGGQGVARAASAHLLLAGDAAGAADPWTGAGVAAALASGRAAGRAAAALVEGGDYSRRAARRAHARALASAPRPHGFRCARFVARLTAACPWLIDAAAAHAAARGDAALARLASVAAGPAPRCRLARPDVGLPILLRAVGEGVGRVTGRTVDLYG